MYSTRPSSLRLEFDIDTRWLKYGAAILIALGFCWLVLVILRAVVAAANDVVLAIQHASPILQFGIAIILLAGLLMILKRIALSIWSEWHASRTGGVA